MKKIIITLLFCMLFHTPMFCHNLRCEKGDTLLVTETLKFIDRINKEYINNSRFAVFVIRGIESDSSSNFCLTLSYIMNSYEYEFVEPQYFFKLNDNFVLISVSNSFDINLFDGFSPMKITSIEMEIIINTLFPKEIGGITYTAQALQYCQVKDRVNKTFFEDSEKLPRWKSIYRKMPGGTIEKIK